MSPSATARPTPLPAPVTNATFSAMSDPPRFDPIFDGRSPALAYASSAGRMQTRVRSVGKIGQRDYSKPSVGAADFARYGTASRRTADLTRTGARAGLARLHQANERGELRALGRFRLGLPCEALGDRRRGHGHAEAKTLQRMDAGRAQEQVLLGGLDALRRDLHAEAAPQADDGVDDGRRIDRALDVADEAAVDFELVEREGAQIQQARVAGAEIV